MAVYSAMLLGIIFAVVAGLIVGLAAGFWLAGSRSRTEIANLRTRAESLSVELADRSKLLEAARERETIQREQIARLETENARIARLEEALQGAQAEQGQLSHEITGLRTQLADRDAQLKAERASAQEKLALLIEARQELSNQFKSLAGDILKENSKSFAEQNQANLGNLLNPLREKFGEFQEKVESLQKEGIAGRSELKEQISNLTSLNQQLSQDAANLVSALKGSSKTQGDWGEFILESLLESSGLKKGQEYLVQESFTRDDRTRAKPDVILNLPEGKHIVIDAKVSLVDYNEYCGSEDEAVRESALARHVGSMRGHIKELSQRNYQALYQLNSLDFVVLFVPIEPAFMLALAQDGKLWEEAWNRNILLVSRTTLLFVLRTVAHLWRQEQQTKNVQEIVRRGGELYDKLAAFAKDLTDVGKSLESARQSYDEAYKKLASGRGNAIRQAELLRRLGIKPIKALPVAMIESALEESFEQTTLELAASEDENNPSETEDEQF